jgi:Na+/H+ antiporter NhaD/arsenite permease-like protein
MEKTVVKDYFPTYLLLGTIILLIAASFIPSGILSPWVSDNINGLICMGLFVCGIIRKFLDTDDGTVFVSAVKDIDYTTLLLLIGLFVVIGGITFIGIVDDIGNLFAGISDNPFIIFSIIVWGSVLLSAFIDNIPYVFTMLPVVQIIAASLNMNPTLFYFGLLCGATLGGNLTPIGASANITALGILRRDGYEVKTGDFMKISVPFTLTAVTVGYVLIWFLWK